MVFYQRPSGYRFTFCLCLLTEEQSHLFRKGGTAWAVQKVAGQSRQVGFRSNLCSAPVKLCTLMWTYVCSPSPKEGMYFFAQRPWASVQLGTNHWSSFMYMRYMSFISYKPMVILNLRLAHFKIHLHLIPCSRGWNTKSHLHLLNKAVPVKSGCALSIAETRELSGTEATLETSSFLSL